MVQFTQLRIGHQSLRCAVTPAGRYQAVCKNRVPLCCLADSNVEISAQIDTEPHVVLKHRLSLCEQVVWS